MSVRVPRRTGEEMGRGKSFLVGRLLGNKIIASIDNVHQAHYLHQNDKMGTPNSRDFFQLRIRQLPPSNCINIQMACVQRMIRSGIRLYKPRGIDSAASTINRVGASTNSYRSFFSSSSSDDGQWILSNGKRRYFVDTFSMVSALSAKGIHPKHAKAITSSTVKVLAELEKDPPTYPTMPSSLLHTKLESLRKTINKMRLESPKDTACVQHADVNPKRRFPWVQHSHVNSKGRRVPGKLANLSAEPVHLNEIHPEAADALREELARLRQVFKLDMGNLLPNSVGVYLTLDPSISARAKSPS